MQEMQVQSLGQEDPLEEEMSTHSSILAGKIPGTEEPDGIQSVESHRWDMTERFLLYNQVIQLYTHTHTHTHTHTPKI